MHVKVLSLLIALETFCAVTNPAIADRPEPFRFKSTHGNHANKLDHIPSTEELFFPSSSLPELRNKIIEVWGKSKDRSIDNCSCICILNRAREIESLKAEKSESSVPGKNDLALKVIREALDSKTIREKLTTHATEQVHLYIKFGEYPKLEVTIYKLSP